MTAPVRQHGAILLLTFLIGRHEVQPTVTGRNNTGVDLDLPLALTIGTSRLEVIRHRPVVAPDVALRVEFVQACAAAATTRRKPEPDVAATVAAGGTPNRDGAGEVGCLQNAHLGTAERIACGRCEHAPGQFLVGERERR